MQISFKRAHIKEISALFKKHKVQFSPFYGTYQQDEYRCSLLKNADHYIVTFLILTEKIVPSRLSH